MSKRNVKNDREDRKQDKVSTRVNKARRGRKNTNRNRADDVDKTRNDPRWYGSVPALVSDAASYPYAWPTGLPVNLDDADGGYKYNVPGIMTLHINPAFGHSQDSRSALNVAVTSMYQYIRAKNSGAKNYEAPDVGVYLIVMSSLISYITMLCRVYGICSLYDQRNRYFPEALCRAMGVDYSSIRGNLADFRFYINRFIAKVQSLPLPKTIPLFERAAFLFQNYYLEGDSIKDQIYMYVPEGFYKYDYDSSGAGMAKYFQWWSSTPLSYAQLVNFGEDMVDRLLNDSDIPIIGGDIRKAYDEAALIRVATITDDFTVLPIRDDWFLYQFKNAFTTYAVDTTGIDVTQDPTKAFLLFKIPGVPVGTGAGLARVKTAIKQTCGDRIITIDADHPTADMTMEFTRLTVTGEWDSVNEVAVYYAGSEYAVSFDIWYYDQNNVLQQMNQTSIRPYDGTSTAVTAITLRLAELIRAFKYAPVIMLTETDASGVTTNKSITCEIDNFTVIDVQGIKKIHDAAFINELHIDRLAVNG